MTDTPRPDPLVALRELVRAAEVDHAQCERDGCHDPRTAAALGPARAALDSIEEGSRPPEDTRLVLMSEELAVALGASRIEWGEPDEHGWYTPTLHREDDGTFIATLLHYADRAHDNESYRTLVSETLLRDAAEIIRDYRHRAAGEHHAGR